MKIQTVECSTTDGNMPTYLATPDGDSRGGIIVIQEAYGVTTYIEDVARRLAAVGWTAAAPSLFHRFGSPVLSYDDTPTAMSMIAKIDSVGINADVSAVLNHFEVLGLSPEQCGIVGFCMGGSAALMIGVQQRLGAAVTFYGAGLKKGRFGYPGLIEVGSQLQTPWLGLFGDQDPSIPPDQVEELRACTKAASVPVEIVRYPDAGHAFHCNDRGAYNENAANDGWNRTLAWFDEHISQS